jgi:hypothetical protein
MDERKPRVDVAKGGLRDRLVYGIAPEKLRCSLVRIRFQPSVDKV